MDDDIEVVFENVPHVGLTRVKPEHTVIQLDGDVSNTRYRWAFGRSRRQRRWIGVQKTRGDLTITEKRNALRLALRRRLSGFARETLVDLAMVLSEHFRLQKVEVPAVESAQTEPEKDHQGDSDDTEKENIPAAFRMYRNNSCDVDDDEITVVYQTENVIKKERKKERKDKKGQKKREKEKNRSRKDTHRAQAESEDHGGRRDKNRHTDKGRNEQRNASRREEERRGSRWDSQTEKTDNRRQNAKRDGRRKSEERPRSRRDRLDDDGREKRGVERRRDDKRDGRWRSREEERRRSRDRRDTSWDKTDKNHHERRGKSRVGQRRSEKRRREPSSDSDGSNGSTIVVDTSRSTQRNVSLRHSRLTPAISGLNLTESARDDRPSSRRSHRSERIAIREEFKERSRCEEYFIDTVAAPHYGSSSVAFDSDFIPMLALELSGENVPRAFNFTFESLANECKAVALKRVEKTMLSSVAAPLGAAFDPVLNMFLYTDSGREGAIHFATYEGHVKEKMKGFDTPSAIAIITAGSHFAVLDRKGITMVDMFTNKKIPVAGGFNGEFRGLATMCDGSLASVSHVRVPHLELDPSVVVWSCTSYNTRLITIPLASQNSLVRSQLPCFLASQGEMLYMTDIELNVISAFSYSKENRKLSYVAKRDVSSQSRVATSALRTRFMSGVVVDSVHTLLVADARGRSIHHTTSNGSLIQNIPFLDEDDRPYISGMAIAPTGRLMVCCRRDHAVRMFDLVPLDSEEDRLSKRLKRTSLPG